VGSVSVATPVAVSASGARPVRRALIAGPVACGCLLAGAAAYVAIVDPASPGTHLVSCPLYDLTGLWCPACGVTRATHALLRGNVAAAFGYNVLFPLFLGTIVVGWLAWLRATLGRTPIHWVTRIRPAQGVLVAVVLVAFGVLRNVPAFSGLAP
jgi:Protein of unknown function (DUF2752)